MAFTFAAIATQVLVGFGLQLLGYLIMPKPKGPQPEETQDLELPTAQAGTPIFVAFGDITIKSPNVLWYGEKNSRNKKVGGGK